MNMDHKTYLISELENLTGLPRRTIHFYVQRGLVPPPSGKGGPAPYSEESLLRLQMIRVLQGSHLKLDGIREALDSMSAAQMREIVARAEAGHKEWDVDALKSWIEPELQGTKHSGPRNFSFARLGAELPEKEQKNLLAVIKRQGTATGERWERFTVTEGIELSLRDEHSGKAQLLLQALARELKKIS